MAQGAHKKIGAVETFFMLAIAVTIDLLQIVGNLLNAVPVIGTAASIMISLMTAVIAWIVFTVWFFVFHGVAFINPARPQKMLAKVGLFVGDSLPIISFLPAITLAVVWTILENEGPNGMLGKAISRIPGVAGRFARVFTRYRK